MGWQCEYVLLTIRHSQFIFRTTIYKVCLLIYITQVDQEEGDSEGSGRYGTIPPFPPPPPGLDGIYFEFLN